jgi:hypothetical protein
MVFLGMPERARGARLVLESQRSRAGGNLSDSTGARGCGRDGRAAASSAAARERVAAAACDPPGRDHAARR